MAKWIQRIFSLGRGLSDAFVVSLCGVPLLLFLYPETLPSFLYVLASSISIYFLVQIYLRLSFRQNQYKAAKRSSKKSTHWAQSFIVQHLSEIRRPIQGLVGVREVYDLDFENKDTQEYMEIVNHCSEHVIRLINRLQLYSELRSGEYTSKDVRFTLANVLEDSLKVAETSNPGKKVSVDQHISPKVLRDYFGPYDLIRALVVEIIDNSIRYSPRADIEISADNSMTQDHNLVIRIRDRGPGITKKIQKELQCKLDRKASSFDLKAEGEGLGVPLMRSLANALSANIKIKTEKGRGTEFEIHIRLPSYSAYAADVKKEKKNNSSDQILIVEDDPLVQKIVAAMLNRLGYRSTVVSNGHDAVELCRRQKFGFILMDLEMPLMDGWEAAQHILNSCNKGEEPAIIALSARNSPTDRARAQKAGCQHFLPKPINKDQLDTQLRNIGIDPHFLPNTNFQEDKFDGLELLAGKTVDFSKLFNHYDRDMSLCQTLLNQAVESMPKLLEDLDRCILQRDQVATKHCLHQLTGELRALLCNAGVHLVERLESHDDPDNIDFISDLEQLNRYCDSLLKEISILSKHNEVQA